MRRLPLVAVLVAAAGIATPVFAAPGNGNGNGHQDGKGHGHWVAPARDNWAGHGIDPTNPQACDDLDPAQYMLPYPNDWFTKRGAQSETGRLLYLKFLAMPHNARLNLIEPQEWNRSDGFSAGALILT